MSADDVEVFALRDGHFEVVRGGIAIGWVWRRRHDDTWGGAVVNGDPLGTRAGFATMADAVGAVVAAAR